MKIRIILLLTTISFFACSKTGNEPFVFDPINTKDSGLVFHNSLKPVLFDFTSTGCPGCGSWGKPTFNSLSKEYSENIVPIAVHIKYGDPMITAFSNEIAANRYGQIYTPQIWVNDTNGVQLVNNNINPVASINTLKSLISNSKSKDIAFAEGIILNKSSEKLEVKLGVKFKNNPVNGDYYLSCYLLQDNILHNQSSSPTNPTTHNSVIVDAFNNTWGAKVELNPNNEFEYRHSFDLKQNGENMHLVSILWLKKGNRYVALGGFKF